MKEANGKEGKARSDTSDVPLPSYYTRQHLFNSFIYFMDLAKALLQAQENLHEFEKKHAKTIQEYERLTKQVELADQKVRDWCKTNKQDVAAGSRQYRYTQPYKSWFDYEAVKSILPKKLMPLLEQITVTVHEVDKEQVSKLIKEGVFPETLKLSKEQGGAYCEEAMSPRVTTVEPKEV